MNNCRDKYNSEGGYCDRMLQTNAQRQYVTQEKRNDQDLQTTQLHAHIKIGRQDKPRH
jgi:hypothetical protein